MPWHRCCRAAGSVILTLLFCQCFLAHGHFYDEETNKLAADRTKRQTAVVGSSCIENTDCRRGAYCDSTRRCACLTTYTQISGYCWQKINPGQAGCTYNAQCSAVWPNAYCNGGACRCGNNQPPFQTNDGPVCVNYGFCPINGENTKLRDTTGQAAGCPFGNPICPAASYDCICATENCTTDSTGSVSSVTFCCPSRALACIMPLDQGTTPTGGGGAVTRYYHNSVTGNCETFSYRGNGGNANNFETLDQCTSYCKQLCLRGQPQYDPATYPNKYQPIRYCTSVSSTACDSNHYCYDRGTNSICCPTSSYICSQSGGITYTTLPATYYDPGVQSDSTVTFARYYYDATQRQCLPFTYYGQGGNFNQFLSEEQCSRYCALTVCLAGEPLRDRTGLTNVACTSSSSCPATHECRNQVCCPRKQTVCSQPKAVGTCGNYVEKWWYNAATRNCELFTFSGCQGNDNNFDTYDACQTFCQDANVEPLCIQGRALKDSYGNYIVCGGTTQLSQTCPANYLCYFDGTNYGCCPTQAYTCALNYDQGTVCGPTSNRWYFNSAQRRCVTFTFNGCDGNSNNFATQTDCRDYCGVGGCPEGGEPFRETSGQYRVCTAGVSCPSTHYCTQVSLGLSGTTTTTTYNYCCPTRTYICSLPRDQGVRCGSSTLNRYYFNVATRNCETMSFNGCEGNRNNFATLAQCLNYCNSAGCPAGQIALQDTINSQLSTCTTGVANSCGATGYSCVYSTLLGQNICCGATVSADTCPANQNAYISPFTNNALQCQPNVAGSCPSGFSCWYSVTQNQYFCCGSATVRCPQGGSPYIDQGTNAGRQCTPGVTGACPSGYTCQSTSITIGGVSSTTGYCCGASNLCGTGYEPYFLNNQAVACNINTANVCPAPYQCRLTNTGTGQYYCCRPSQTVAVDVCGLGRTPYVINNAPVVCSTGSTSTNCPTPYQCLLYQATNTFYCCQQGAVTPAPTNRCPPGYNPLVTNGQYTFCSPTSNTCPPNYPYCQFDSQQRRYICCGSGVVASATCPNGQTTTQTCVIGQACTTPGYTCTQIQGRGSYCCPAAAVTCLGGTTTTTTCTGNRCPAGFTCTNVGSGQYCCPVNAVTCPDGTTSSTSCLGNPAACLAGTTCTSVAGGQYCCRTVSTNVCPSGQQAQLNPATRQAQACTPGVVSGCNAGYSCMYSPTAFSYYCCGTGTPVSNTYCPAGLQVYVNPSSNQPQFCTPGISSCPGGYQCTASTLGANYCCGSGIVSNTGCSSGRAAYIAPGTASPATCAPGQFTNCPPGYVCEYSTTFFRYQCCQSSGGIINPGIINPGTDAYGCPSGSSYLYPGTQTPLACTPTSACPGGYRCLRSVRYSGYQCCSSFRNTAKEKDDVRRQQVKTILQAMEVGCASDLQCKAGAGIGARCLDGRCLCAQHQVALNGLCRTHDHATIDPCNQCATLSFSGSAPCPPNYRNEGGICIKH